MSLAAILEAHRTRTRTLTIYAPERPADVEEWFDFPGVEVEYRSLPDDGTGGFVAVSEDGQFLGSVPVAALRDLVRPDAPPAPGERSRAEDPLRRLLELLRDVTFRAFDRRQLLAVAREIEDRAVRIGEGGLHAGFQRPGALRAQADLYEALAADTDLDVHVYLDADWETPDVDLSAERVHEASDSELGRFWFVVFDGGPDPLSACGLLAEEGTEGYHGFWTYDAATVDRILTYLRDAY